MSYLRFTPDEYRAIRRACRSLDLSDDFFAVFKYFLVESLADTLPGLSQRLAQVPARKLRILYEYLKEHKTCRARSYGRFRGKKDEAWGGLTIRESQAVRQASDLFFLHEGSLPSFQDYLVFAFRETTPGLASKLARFSRHRIARLYQDVKKRSRGVA
jgi:hypothetical protein